MSRYFFHVMDGMASIDTDGTEIATLGEARSQAINTAGRILSEMDQQLWDSGRTWTMTVADASGKVVFTLNFSADDHGI